MIKIPSLQKIASLPWVAKLIAFAGLLAPGIASAAPDFGFTPPCSDKSISTFLVPLFGSLFDRCGGVAGPFEQAIGVVNAGALTIGGMIAAYTLVVGTMQTAHDGEMLGKRWSSMWIPIRTVLGIGLVVPLAGGYCVAQLLIGFLIGQGVGLADKVWEAYVNNLGDAKNMAPKVILPSVDDLARGILRGQLCMEAINYLSKDKGMIPELKSTPTNSGTQYGEGRCGGVSYAAVTQAMATLNSATGGKVSGAVNIVSPLANLLNFSALDVSNTVPVLQAHITAAGTLEARMQQVAVKIVNAKNDGTTAPDIGGDLVAAEAEYQKTVASAANAVAGGKNGLAELVAAAKNDGWFMAGSWFMKASQLQDTINRVVSNTPSAENMNMDELSELMRDLAPYMAVLEKSFRKSSNAVSPATANLAPETMSNGSNGSNTGGGLPESLSRIASSTNPVSAGFVEVSNYYFIKIARGIVEIDSNRDPMMALKDTGDTIMVVGGTLILVAGMLYTVAGVADGVGSSFLGSLSVAASAIAKGARDAMRYLATMMILFGAPLLFFGAGLAIYLPMDPFLIFVGIFVGWLLLCLEAVIAAPLWAIMHLSPQGDDIMGGARGGYMLILGLLLRPMLIVMGFIAALISLPVIITSFNSIFFPVFKMSMTGSVVGIFSTIIMVFMYFGTMTFLFHTIFSFMGQIPDKILRWMGGGGEQLGEVGRGMSGSGKAHEKAQVATQLGHTAMQQSAAFLDRKQNREMNEQNKSTAAMSEKDSSVNSAASKVQEQSLTALDAKETARNDGSVGSQAKSAVATHGLAQSLSQQAESNKAAAQTASSQAAESKDQTQKESLTQTAGVYSQAASAAATKAGLEQKALEKMRGTIGEKMADEGVKADSMPTDSTDQKEMKVQALQGAANNYKAMRDAENTMGNQPAAEAHQDMATAYQGKADALRAEVAKERKADDGKPPPPPANANDEAGIN